MPQIILGPNKAYPSIPSIGNDTANHTIVLEAVREALAIHERRTNNVFDSFVRLSELVELGIVNIDPNTGIVEAPDDDTDASITHNHDTIYIRLDGASDYTTGEILFGAGIRLENATALSVNDSGGTAYEALILSGSTPGGTPVTDPNLGSVTYLASFENGTAGAEVYTPEIGPSMNWSIVSGTQPTQVDGEISTAQAKFGTQSLYFKELFGAPNAGWCSDSKVAGTTYGFAGDFTIETHIYIVDNTSEIVVMGLWDYTERQWILTLEAGNGRLNFVVSTSGIDNPTVISQHSWGVSTGVPTGAWHHIAVCRSGNNWYAWLDGVQSDQGTQTLAYTIYQPAGGAYLVFGQYGYQDGGSKVEVYLDNVRITDGVARYTTSFTPPAVPYEGSTSTQALVFGDPALAAQIDGDGLTIDTDATVTGTLLVTGATTLSSTLGVTGAATLSSTLGVAGVTELQNTTNYIGGVAASAPWYYNAGAQVEYRSGLDLWIRDAGFLRIYDSGDTDYIQISHNGADALIATSNTSKIQFSGASYYRFDNDIVAEAGIVARGAVSNDGITGLFAYMDSLGSYARFGAFAWNTGQYEPVRVQAEDWRYYLGTGGTTNVLNLTTTLAEYNVPIKLTPQAAPSHTEGWIWYDSSEKALSYYNDEADVTINVGQENVVRVRNTTGVTITNGSVVYISGATGANLPNVSLAQANALATSRVLGIATHDIENNSNGYVTSLGLVNNVNTSAFSAGEALYLSTSTPGGLVNTRPTTGYAVVVGYCTISNISVGQIKVLPGITVQQADLVSASDNETILARWIFQAGADVTLGTTFRIWDATNSYYGELYHDGNELWNNLNNTTHDWVVAKGGTRYMSHVATSRFDLYLGTDLRIYDGTNTGYGSFDHDGTDFNTTFLATTDWNIDGVVIRIRSSSGVRIQDGADLRIQDATDLDYASFSHDGTDFNTVMNGTTSWNVSGLTGMTIGHTAPLLYQRAVTAVDTGGQQVALAAESNSAFSTLIDIDNSNAAPTYGVGIRFNLAGTTNSYIGFRRDHSASSHVAIAGGHSSAPYHAFYNEGSGYYCLLGGDIRVYDGTNTDYVTIYDTGSISYLQSSTNPIYISSGAGAVYFYNGAGTEVRIYEAAGADYLSILHNGTTVQYSGAGIAAHQFNQRTDVVGGGLQVHSGLSFNIYDATNLDYAIFQHDGTNFNTTFTNTNSWNIKASGDSPLNIHSQYAGAGWNYFSLSNSGGTRTAYFGMDPSNNFVFDNESGGTFKFYDRVDANSGAWFRAYDSGGTNYLDMYFATGEAYLQPNTGNLVFYTSHAYAYKAGSNALLSAYASTGLVRIYMQHDGASGYLQSTGGSLYLAAQSSAYVVGVLSGAGLRVLDSANTNYYQMTHDGTDIIFNLNAATADYRWQHNGSTKWVMDGSNGGLLLSANGGYMRIYDSSNTDYGQFQHDGTDFNFSFVTTTDVNFSNFSTDFVAGNYRFNANQTVGAGQDNYVLTYDNGTGKIGLEAASGASGSALGYKYKTAAETVLNSTTLQDDDHFTGWSLDAGAYYIIEGFIDYDQDSDTTDLKIVWSFTNAPQTSTHNWSGTGTAAAVGTLTSSIVFNSTAGNYRIKFQGAFQANATTGGTCKIQWALQATAGAGLGITMNKGSWMRVFKIS